MKEKFGVRGSYREVAKLLSTTQGTIGTRYTERGKIAKGENLTLDEVIENNYLQKAVNDYLNRLDDIKQFLLKRWTGFWELDTNVFGALLSVKISKFYCGA